MDDTVFCIICNGTEGTLTTIHEVAIKNLIETSKKRVDNQHLKWSKLSTASVHKACSANYHRQNSIKKKGIPCAEVYRR